MDWKYEHFHQERVFPAPRDVVVEAARAFMAESLGWQITVTSVFPGLPKRNPGLKFANAFGFSIRSLNLQTLSALESGARIHERFQRSLHGPEVAFRCSYMLRSLQWSIPVAIRLWYSGNTCMLSNVFNSFFCSTVAPNARLNLSH